MEEYLKESKEVSEWEGFGESYDKEWALRDQGLRDGIAKGLVQGEEKKKIEMVRAMLSKGINIKLVSECSGLSIEELEKIRETVEVNLGESYDKEWALRDQGLRDGIAKGKEEKTKEFVRNMLNCGVSLEDISKYTTLSIEQIKNIQKS